MMFKGLDTRGRIIFGLVFGGIAIVGGTLVGLLTWALITIAISQGLWTGVIICSVWLGMLMMMAGILLGLHDATDGMCPPEVREFDT